MIENVFPVAPLGDRLFVKRLDAVEKRGGIFIPDGAKEKPVFGKVVVAGPGVLDTALRANVLVLFGRYAGTEVNVLGEDYLLMREEEVQGVIVNREVAEQLVGEGA